MSTSLSDLIRDLGLAPHPEGGWYREIHRSAGNIELERGRRSAVTVIDYAIETGSFSTFHRVASEEVWTWCAGEPLALSLLRPSGRLERFLLGPVPDRGQRRVAVVPAGVWQAAEPLTDADGGEAHGYAWCSCVVVPGFDFADFELASRDALVAEFPDHGDLVRRLTRA